MGFFKNFSKEVGDLGIFLAVALSTPIIREAEEQRQYLKNKELNEEIEKFLKEQKESSRKSEIEKQIEYNKNKELRKKIQKALKEAESER